MKKAVYILLSLLLFASCGRVHDKYCYHELSNKELEREILEYTRIRKNLYGNDKFIVKVMYQNINDSMTYYKISHDRTTHGWTEQPFHFVCKVGGRDVLFTKMSDGDGYQRKEFFNVKKDLKVKLMRKYFKDEYRYYRKGWRYPKYVDRTYQYNLMFLNGKLIDKFVDDNWYYDNKLWNGECFLRY